MSGHDEIVVLFRPVGQDELDFIRESGNRCFPPRLAQQPIFYPVLSEEYATQIARDWNAKHNEPPVGYVTRFCVRKRFVEPLEIHCVGSSLHQEYWIPAAALEEFNQNIIGEIEVIAEFRS